MARSLSDSLGDQPTEESKRLRAQLAKLEHRLARAESDARELQAVVDRQAELLERQTRVFKSKAGRIMRGTWTRVVIPDTHGCHIDPQAAAAFLKDLEYLDPREVVWLGDHLDCGGFLAQHHTMGYVAETEYSFADDVAATNGFLDAVQKRAPKAVHHYISGNHERRIERWCVTECLRNGKDAAFLLSHFGPDAVLRLAARGFHYYAQGVRYGSATVPATIKLGNCWFTHGSKSCRRPAQAMLGAFSANVVFGHNHIADMVIEEILDKPVLSACAMCLCRRQPMWHHTDPSRWSHGYALQTCHRDGDFLHITVPIVNGRSLLGPLLNR